MYEAVESGVEMGECGDCEGARFGGEVAAGLRFELLDGLVPIVLA